MNVAHGGTGDDNSRCSAPPALCATATTTVAKLRAPRKAKEKQCVRHIHMRWNKCRFSPAIRYKKYGTPTHHLHPQQRSCCVVCLLYTAGTYHECISCCMLEAVQDSCKSMSWDALLVSVVRMLCLLPSTSYTPHRRKPKSLVSC